LGILYDPLQLREHLTGDEVLIPWVGILEQGARAMTTAAKDDIVRTLGIDLARTSSTSD